jgi:hypothetical protein
LHERRGCRHGQKRQADRPGHQPDQPRDRRAPDGRLPIRTDRHRQAERGDGKQAEVAHDLPARSNAAAEAVSIGVAGEQRALEEHHGGVPHGGRAAEERQRHAREHRLDREHQERAEQHGAGEPRQRDRAAPCAALERKPFLALPDAGFGHPPPHRLRPNGD